MIFLSIMVWRQQIFICARQCFAFVSIAASFIICNSVVDGTNILSRISLSTQHTVFASNETITIVVYLKSHNINCKLNYEYMEAMLVSNVNVPVPEVIHWYMIFPFEFRAENMVVAWKKYNFNFTCLHWDRPDRFVLSPIDFKIDWVL